MACAQLDLANSRATTQTDIDSSNVSTLTRKWAFKLPYVGLFGAFTSNPIVLNEIVYIQDPDSNVYALDQNTGAVIWKHAFKSIDVGAATVANDVVFTSTFDGTSYALSTKDGSVLWSAKAPAGINSFPAVMHDFDINGKKTPMIQPGKTATLVVTLKKKGNYRYLCTVPGHAEAGMKGVFTVH